MTTSIEAQAPPRATTGRALAPDLARGAMLLAIAFAHAPLFVTDVRRGPAALNAITDVFHFLFVNNHARPMFAFLFGYALVQLLDRRLARPGGDWVSARKLLRRRGWWLMAIGLTHVVLLVPIDILAPYGLAAVLLAGLLRRGDRALLWTAGLTFVPATAVVAASMWFPMSNGISTYTKAGVSAGGQGFWSLLTERLTAWPISLAVGTLLVIPGVLLGMWAARRRYLEEPARHRRLLLGFAVITTALSVAGSLPAALVQADVWTGPSPAALWAAVLAQAVTGYAGGIGMAALVALVAIRAGRRRNRLTTMVEALGRRSMSLYLFQSVAYVVLFYPYGMGLQDDLGLAGATLVAAGTWLISLLLADLMARVGYRGPAEILLRRLAYR
ncbi:DUF418 domain-containing protein [Nonomuraea gerenzanensis]|uniref:DUF418 domain-containing protein n=1 Tax=Nonomuraea gerenzanensis TaxID=93944 RepID=A0A1M4EMZ4_9ACTN|nr:DUF418 domain-containing protein [Nonomuraea gerenzanensis]UBU11722.1 DUF418 domain-containing protein [Nonomuraea gerenzanensis]SBP00222.1 hypothetical protein BN4615_P9738 [Nonomuraea gerenzanensis]